MKYIKHIIKQNLNNIYSWKINKKIVVIESDDWGSTRINTNQIASKLLKKGFKIDNCPFSMFDSLENTNDIELLANLVEGLSEKFNKRIIITLNLISGNPDFDKMKEFDYDRFFFRPLNVDYKEFANGNEPMVIQKATEKDLFKIQYHGKQHLNTNAYLQVLKNFKEFKFAADFKTYAFSFASFPENKIPFLITYKYFKGDKLDNYYKDLNEGLIILESLFDRPTSFIPPVYTSNKYIESYLATLGISSIQGLNIQRDGINNNFVLRYGKFNRSNQVQLRRNCFYEPSTNANKDWISSCMKQIKNAFKHNHPAIISSHRLNYVSGRNINLRDKNLIKLEKLIIKINEIYPDVEFMDSSSLANYVTKVKN